MIVPVISDPGTGRSIYYSKSNLLELAAMSYWLSVGLSKVFVERDRVEGVILLPENLFYNTTAPGVVILLNRLKPLNRKGEFLLINAADYFVKGDPKNILTQEGIKAVDEVYRNWETREKLSKVVKLEELREADYNLSPSQFVDVSDKVVHRSIEDILTDLAVAPDF